MRTLIRQVLVAAVSIATSLAPPVTRTLEAQQGPTVQLPSGRDAGARATTARRAASRAPYLDPCALADASCAPPTLAREFRGVWVASVSNIDWPSKPGLSPSKARRELIVLLDRAKASGLNAVILQVRPAGDALYRSALEPWSEYLTGRQGRAPFPAWDPLEFAVREAHRRGLELHAWFNPYRARHPSARGPESARHLARTRPDLVKRYGTHLWMDPGEPEVRARTVAVVTDVVRRYDIDGVHLDDYFYPYKERDARGASIDFPDTASYARYVAGGGTLGKDDWRRQNVDQLVESLYDTIHATKPWVKFGVSPFGIWRPGNPAIVRGFDAYSELYADARKWLQEGWVDYFAPQLYWPVAQPAQPYAVLLRWWAEQNAHGRNLWPGNYTSRVGERSRTAWRTSEIESQIDLTRAEPGATGNIHFSAKVLLEDRDAVATRMGGVAYRAPALIPSSPWLAVAEQGAPVVTVRRSLLGRLSARVVPSAGEAPRWWLVQVRMRDGAWQHTLVRGDAKELALAAQADRLAVRAVDGAQVEGPVTVIKLRD